MRKRLVCPKCQLMRTLLIFSCLAACTKSAGAPRDAASIADADAAGPCTTRISYGSRWIKPANHPASFDVTDGNVTWDGTCTDDGASSYATLSNGWKPYFTGNQTCAIALDPLPSCGAAASCSTRITYGSAWLRPTDHPAQHDDVTGRVFWDGACAAAGSDSRAELSNGWQPHFTGATSCAMSLRWTGCGGLYANPVVALDCPDPGVAFDGTRYIMTCTSGGAANAFPLYVSTDLVTWTPKGHILPAAAKPSWATGDFWAPELHKIGNRWLAYWSARSTTGRLAIGAASADDPLGPYTALPAPLVADGGVGLIDAHALVTNGTAYLLWKDDGNAQNAPTPIKARELTEDGLAFKSATTTTLITNDKPWEDNLVEAPWITKHDASYYLFYSGNAYFDGRYAVGVARATSPLGPYTKAPAPILTTSGNWVGPGHNSVIKGPGGGDYMVYHAWQLGHVHGPGDGRMVLVDQIQWRDGWPVVYGAPSAVSRPLP